jgi:muconolactone delta-isomerase
MNEENKNSLPNSVTPQPSQSPIPNPGPTTGNPNNTAQNIIQEILAKEPNSPQKPKLDEKFVQKPIRTYESDLAEALSGKQGSLASIAIAENKRQDEERRQRAALEAAARMSSMRDKMRGTVGIPQTPLQNAVIPQAIPQAIQQSIPQSAPAVESEIPKKSLLIPVLFTFLSLFLIGGGVGIGIYVYNSRKANEPVPITQTITVPSLIPSDKRSSVVIGESQGMQLVQKMYAEINKSSIAPGTISEVAIYTKAGEDARRVTSTQFLEKIGARSPDVIMRSLTDRWEFGVYGEETGEKTTFIALTTDFFQNAFAGMLAWEDAMPDDLALVLNFKEKARRQDLAASSSISSFFSIQGDWSDRTIRNRDVREFKKSNGELLFLYSFINKETLVITTTESAFVHIIERIEKDIYVR